MRRTSPPSESPSGPTTARLQQELLHRGRELRALARHLVGDQDADDVVQESAAVALRRPPADASRIDGWLRTIVRSVANNHRRSDRRRREREQAARSSGAAPSAATLAAERESLERLTSALLRLEEPFRSTLMLRAFHGLRPAQIAARLGVPVATVKSRHRRGLARLRAELAERDPDWRTGLVAALGLDGSRASSFSKLTPWIWMPKPFRSAAIAAVLLLGATLLLLREERAPATPLAAGSASAPVSGTERDTTDREPRPTGRRERTTLATIPPGLDLAHPFGFTLRCVVLDPEGFPVEGARLAIAPEGSAWNVWPETTGPDGSIVLDWRGRQPSESVAIGTLSGTDIDAPTRLRVAAGHTANVALLGRQITMCGGTPQATDCNACHVAPGTGSRRIDFEDCLDLHPEARFADLPPRSFAEGRTDGTRAGTARHAAEYDAHVAWIPAGAARESIPHLVDRAPTDMMTVVRRILARRTTEAGTKTDGTGTVEGRVFDVAGRPAPNVAVAIVAERILPRSRTRTDADGRFVLEGVAIGRNDVRATDDLRGCCTVTVDVVRDVPSPCELQLEPGNVLDGRVLLPESAADTSWRVELATDDGRYRDAAAVSEAGHFRFTTRPATNCTLTLLRKNGTRMPVAWQRGVPPSARSVTFDLRPDDAAPNGRLVARMPTDDRGAGSGRVEIRLWQVETGRGLLTSPQLGGQDAEGPNGESVVRIDGLASGRYVLEWGAVGSAWQSQGPFWIDGRGETDRGWLARPTATTLELPQGAGTATAVQLFRRTVHGDRHVVDITGATARRIVIPSGTWLLLGATADGGLFGEELELTPGRRHRWPLDGR